MRNLLRLARSGKGRFDAALVHHAFQLVAAESGSVALHDRPGDPNISLSRSKMPTVRETDRNKVDVDGQSPPRQSSSTLRFAYPTT
jgi:hypothetical protein